MFMAFVRTRSIVAGVCGLRRLRGRQERSLDVGRCCLLLEFEVESNLELLESMSVIWI